MGSGSGFSEEPAFQDVEPAIQDVEPVTVEYETFLLVLPGPLGAQDTLFLLEADATGYWRGQLTLGAGDLQVVLLDLYRDTSGNGDLFESNA